MTTLGMLRKYNLNHGDKVEINYLNGETLVGIFDKYVNKSHTRIDFLEIASYSGIIFGVDNWNAKLISDVKILTDAEYIARRL